MIILKKILQQLQQPMPYIKVFTMDLLKTGVVIGMVAVAIVAIGYAFDSNGRRTVSESNQQGQRVKIRTASAGNGDDEDEQSQRQQGLFFKIHFLFRVFGFFEFFFFGKCKKKICYFSLITSLYLYFINFIHRYYFDSFSAFDFLCFLVVERFITIVFASHEFSFCIVIFVKRFLLDKRLE